jgi:hypothetical protein
MYRSDWSTSMMAASLFFSTILSLLYVFSLDMQQQVMRKVVFICSTESFVCTCRGVLMQGAPSVPLRIAYCSYLTHDSDMCIAEVQQRFTDKHEGAVLTAKDGQLTKAFKPTLRDLARKYEDPTQVDRILAVQSQINVVTGVMQENISRLLENDEKLERIAEAAEDLVSLYPEPYPRSRRSCGGACGSRDPWLGGH